MFYTTQLFYNFIHIQIPFLEECFIIIFCIFYLSLCCFAKHNWWHLKIDIFLRNNIYKMLFLLLLYQIYAIIHYRNAILHSLYFDDFLIYDFATQLTKMLILFSSVFAFYWCNTFISLHSTRYTYITEFPFLFLGAVLFLLVLISSNDLLAMILCILGMSMCLYGLLIANSFFGKIYREASIKYFIMSALSSGLILGGLKEIYLWTGSLKYNIINNFILAKFCENNNIIEFLSLKIAIVLILFGFMFKISAAPSHFWAPEVYEGTPYSVLIFILLPVKIAIGFILIKIIKVNCMIYGFNLNYFEIILPEIQYILIFIILCSLFIGAINSIFEYKLKRFIAYSSVNQIGFLLMGLLGSTSLMNIQVFFYFLITYIINMTILLGIILNIQYKSWTMNSMATKKFIAFKYIWELKNIVLNNNNIWQAIVLTLCFFSLAGIPPLAGFFGKFYVLFYAYKTGNTVVLISGFLTSILGAFYYLRLVKILFFEKNAKQTNIHDILKNKTLVNNVSLNFFNNEMYRNNLLWPLCCFVLLSFIFIDSYIFNITYKVAQSVYFSIY